MCAVLISLLAGLTSTLRTRASLQFEILALRHQLAVLQRNKRRRVQLRVWDRLLWVGLVRLWPNWRKTLMWSSPRRSSAGIEKDSGSTGTGRVAGDGWDDRVSRRKSET